MNTMFLILHKPWTHVFHTAKTMNTCCWNSINCEPMLLILSIPWRHVADNVNTCCWFCANRNTCWYWVNCEHSISDIDYFHQQLHPQQEETLTLKQDARYRSWTTWPTDVFDACGNWRWRRWTTNSTRVLRDREEPSSSARRIRFKTSSCIASIQIKHQ